MMSEDTRSSGIRITKTTGVTVSVGLLIVLIGGAVGGLKLVYERGRSDAVLDSRLTDLKRATDDNAELLAGVIQGQAEQAAALSRIESATEDRWTRSQMRRLVKLWGQANPELHLPDVDDIE